MKEILLTQNKVTLVDDEDYELLNLYKWYARKSNKSIYAARGQWDGKRQHIIFIHRIIMNLDLGNILHVDHIDGNGLNNQRNNLRIANKQQNSMNQRPQKGKTSKYKGVRWNKINKNWNSQIVINDKAFYLGCFENEIDAAKAYDKKAKELFGEFANLNLE